MRRLAVLLLITLATLTLTGCVVAYDNTLYDCTIEGLTARCVVVGAYLP